MLLSGVLFVLFLAGCWLYCLADAALTPAADFRGLSKATWVGIIAVTFIAGAVAWLITRRPWRTNSSAAGQVSRVTFPGPGNLASPGDTDMTWYAHWTAADAAVARHPASRSKQPTRDGLSVPKGPDDDPEFLRLLDHRIHGTSADPGE
jgi:hypothetical protein